MARTVCAAVIDAEGRRCAVELGYLLSQHFDASLVRSPLGSDHNDRKERAFPPLSRAFGVRSGSGASSGCLVAGVRGSFALVGCTSCLRCMRGEYVCVLDASLLRLFPQLLTPLRFCSYLFAPFLSRCCATVRQRLRLSLPVGIRHRLKWGSAPDLPARANSSKRAERVERVRDAHRSCQGSHDSSGREVTGSDETQAQRLDGLYKSNKLRYAMIRRPHPQSKGRRVR